MHAAPPTPHVALADVWQTPVLSQQPFGQEVASQTQLPWLPHSWFVPQAAQAAPFAPQWAFVAVTHWPLEQQPLQTVPPQLQAPALQVWPDAQVPQVLPPEPQAAVVCCATAMHCVPWQQPLGQEVALQTHAPVLPQVWPAPQLAHAAPPVPH